MQGDCKVSSLEEVDSITFSEEDAANIVFVQDYIDGANTYLFSNGIVLTEKEDSVHGKIIVVDSIDVKQKKWLDAKSFMIYCDSTYKPLVAQNAQYVYYFNYDNYGILSEINTFDFDGNIIESKVINYQHLKTRRASTEGNSPLNGVGKALDIYGLAETYFNPTDANISLTAASWIAKLLPEGIPQDLGSLATSLVDAFSGGKMGWLGIVLAYTNLIRDIGKNRAKYYIGDCTPYIMTAVQNGKNSVVLNLNISGVTATSKDTPLYTIIYWQEIDGERTNLSFATNPQVAENGTHTVTINNLHGGHYGFQAVIFPSLFFGHHNMMNLYSFHSNVVYADVAPLSFETIKQEYTNYANGYVTTSVKAVMDFASEQDKEILAYYKNLGIYVHTDFSKNNIDEYFSVKDNDGLEFYFTFDIPIEDFSFEKDHSTGMCTNKVTFKTYIVDGYGITYFYDERHPQIVFDISNNCPVIIRAVTTTAAQYRPKDHPQHFSYTDKSKEQSENSEKNEEVYEFKYNVTTAVELTDDESVENWGYVYEDKKGKKSRISLKGAPYTYEDKRFVYYRNGDPRTHVAKLYPFVKYTNDEQYYYGMPVDYPLVYPETSTIELTACSTPEIVTKQNVQYNGVTYDYCSTFIFDYDATGAYWLSVGADEFGSGWNNWDANLPKREQAKVADGSNRLTLNYYYNRKVLEGDYMIRLKGTDNTHESGGCISSDYVRLIHNGQVFTGCELKTK